MQNITNTKTDLEILEKKNKKAVYGKQYYIDNRNKIIQKNKIICACGAHTETSHKKQHAFSFKHKNYINAKIIYHIID